jgi:hypothetical protein
MRVPRRFSSDHRASLRFLLLPRDVIEFFAEAITVKKVFIAICIGEIAALAALLLPLALLFTFLCFY